MTAQATEIEADKKTIGNTINGCYNVSMTNINLIGKKFGLLTLIGYLDERTNDNHIKGSFRCDCGETVSKSVSRVVHGYTKTCGASIHMPKTNLSHGMRYTAEYRVWVGLKNRMLNKNSKDYYRYGAVLEISSAIASDFMAFYREVGPRPSKDHSVDRIDNTKGYIEGNLCWSTRSEQESNTSKSYRVWVDGIEYPSLYEAARRLGKSEMTIRRWCDGFYDKRRNSYAPPRKGCRRELKYK